MVTPVKISHTMIRYPNPENISMPEIPCATPTLKGFRNAAAKPTCALTNGIDTPTIES